MTDLDLAKSVLNLENIIPGNKIRKGRYIFVNPCPFCGHADHFVISGTHYHSFNNCCERGTVIDWIMKDYGLSFKKAVKKVLEMANIEEKKPTKKDMQKKNEFALKQEKINNKFNMLYDNLIFIYKVLNKKYEKTNFGIWLFHFIEYWIDQFVETDHDKKEQTINQYRQNVINLFMNKLTKIKNEKS